MAYMQDTSFDGGGSFRLPGSDPYLTEEQRQLQLLQSYQEPAPTYQEPAPIYQEPAPVYQEPIPTAPTSTYQAPTTDTSLFGDGIGFNGTQSLMDGYGMTGYDGANYAPTSEPIPTAPKTTDQLQISPLGGDGGGGIRDAPITQGQFFDDPIANIAFNGIGGNSDDPLFQGLADVNQGGTGKVDGTTTPTAGGTNTGPTGPTGPGPSGPGGGGGFTPPPIPPAARENYLTAGNRGEMTFQNGQGSNTSLLLPQQAKAIMPPIPQLRR
jgi:hypothetical protein